MARSRPSGAILLSAVSPGVAVLVVLAAASSALLALRPSPAETRLELWVFSALHAEMYRSELERLGGRGLDASVRVVTLSLPALEQRMLSGFRAETGVADLVEVERAIIGRAFLGPPDAVGFVDLTERLHDEGLWERLNTPSISPWTDRGAVYGLPHDVHPVMLGYRSDIVEAAGIDLSGVETWDDLFEALWPLTADRDGDGRQDHYILGLWETDAPKIEALMRQAGGRYFQPDGSLALASPENARVLAAVADWCSGDRRVATDVQDFTASGNMLKVRGHAIAYIMPDWMCAIWRTEMPQLAGKVKLMPLPAWDPGGRRTSVWGGTMLGVSRFSEDPEAAWEAARELYFSREISIRWYTEMDTITPVKTYWDDPVFDEPDPYFSGQAKGRMYIDLAPHVPTRVSSPYYRMVEDRMRDALIELAAYARSDEEPGRALLEARAAELLERAQAKVQRWMDRNVFLGSGGADG